MKILIFLILLLGFLLRGQETISRNFLFLMDQGRDMMAVKSILYDHHLTLIGPYTSLQGVFQGPLWYYLLTIPTFIFDKDPWGGIVLMFLISMTTLFLVFIWTKKLFGGIVAIFTLFLFTLSPEAVAAATYIWNPHPMWLLVIIYFFSLYELVVFRKKKYNFILWPTVALMFHFQTALAMFILISSLIFVFIFHRKIIRQKHFYYGIGFASLFFIPQVLFDLRHDFLMTKSILNIFLGSDQGLFVGGENRDYLNLIKGNISLFYYNFSTSFVRDGYLKESPRLVFLIIFITLLLYKKLKFFKNKEGNFLSMSTTIIIIVAFLCLLYPFPLRYWFLTGFQSIYIVIFAVVLSLIWKSRIGKIIILIYFAFLLFYSGEKIYKLYISPPNDGGTAKIKGKKDAIDYIYKDAKGKPFGLLVFTPPVYTYPYDYLIWSYGKKTYSYVPYNDKRGIFYLLIEVDGSKPWSYKGWLDTVIKTGTIIETIELPSGFIIQKRHEEKNKI